MELRQLRAFVAVAEERNFTRAAARLYLAQSGLSATIRSLEKELLTSLFVRTTRRVELTAAGAALLPEARRTLLAARTAADVVAAVEGLDRGTLTLGVMQAGWLFDLAGLLARYRAAYPGIRLELQHASASELGRLLREGALDLTFAPAADDASVGLVTVALLRSRLVACTAEPELARQDAISFGAVAERDQVGYPIGWGVRTLVDSAMRSAEVEPRVDLEVNDTNTLLDLVEAGLGIAVLPEAIARLRPGLHTMRITNGSWDWTIAAQALAPAPVNPAARALWAMIEPTD